MEYTLPQLLKTLVDQGGSDLHLSPRTPPRIRIDGHIVPLQLEPLKPSETAELCYNILNESQKKIFEKEKELDLAFSIKNLARFRANIYHQKSSVSGVFRVIPTEIKSMDDLGLPDVLRLLCHLPKGLVLVTGPTGSGKSTTLAALIDYCNETFYKHILTVEDPIEFVHPHKNSIVNQRELNEDTKSFAKALKSALRQDPDVILVGELRDLETIQLALTAAETGHLVFGTLHTNSCISTLNRIIDVFPPHQQMQVRTQLSMTLEAVISQTLLPKKQGGRVMAMEVMRSNRAISALINEGKFKQIYSSMQTGQSETGMQTMNQSLHNLIMSGLVEEAQAIEKSSNPDEIYDMLGKSNRAG